VNAAAEEPPCFYSILARQVLGERTLKSEGAQKTDIAPFLDKKSVRRAIALKSIGQDALAEKEIRSLFPASGSEDRRHLLQLAQMLNLPAAQMRMAVAGGYDATSADARFPLPHWTPTSGYRLEPALLFAIMRQESGFNPNAKSASGAMGVMQLMPATAHAMAADARMKLSPEPAVSMTLGQHYLERLMSIPAISDNLVYIIASYNAGPGSVISWQKNVRVNDDPLLFVESIPASQTRDYVVHVIGNYWVYSALMGGYDSASVTALAGNRWPRYERSGKQMISMISYVSDAVGAE
jgi:soluble lytic murein transglycosylase-like protein